MNSQSKTTLDTERSKKSKAKPIPRAADVTFEWVARKYPHFVEWRNLATEWVKGEVHSIGPKLQALAHFFERYLDKYELPADPAVLLGSEAILPDFYQAACPDTMGGIKYNNYIHAFLQYVLLLRFGMHDDEGQPVVSPLFRNPVPHRSRRKQPDRDESVHSPLPYGYIDELRQLLAAGPHFRDWSWAHNALGAKKGGRGRMAPDWFAVTADQIDRTDPDCVWRIRERSKEGGGDILEMWSPVRWVAILIKLILPLRTMQVRMLDSGEADTWRFDKGAWKINEGPLAQGSERSPLELGVFRRSKNLSDINAVPVLLYINTNKTADMAKSGPAKGYVMPWTMGGRTYQDAFYWLEKLRNWQEKYNPTRRRVAWSELDVRHILIKSDIQLATYPDAVFLFRLPEARGEERHLPVGVDTLDYPWQRLLAKYESQLLERGEAHENGAPIRLVPAPEENRTRATTHFPLHGLRVSLITALALEGQVPFPILQKLVGHSRLLMTLYYTKPGATHIHDLLVGATERIEAKKNASIQNFLLDTEHERLVQQAICNSESSLAAVIPLHPAARNPAGWMPMHHGLCLVGGNTSRIEGKGKVGGCYNGGSNFGTSGEPSHGPVPGGSRNCVRCRWFVTEPHYLPALVSHFNTLAYHFDETRNACLADDNVLQDLKKQKADAEESGHPFPKLDAYRQAERVWESDMNRFSDLAEDLVACWRLIERCKTAVDTRKRDGSQLIAVGTDHDVNVIFEETESELLQLTGVCENVEIYPDLQLGKAVFRRSQLLDAVLYRENLPPMFMMLTEQDQLLLGNAFMRRLSQQMNPVNPALGQREVIRLMDDGARLGDYFGVDLATLFPITNPSKAVGAGREAFNGSEQWTA